MESNYSPVTDDQIELTDRRKLRYCIWGDVHGRPVYFFHGAPGSRFFTPDPATTLAAGVRLVSVDRPGYGGSDPQPGREILDWPTDIEQLADALNIDSFDVVAHSSGGPYALACALKMAERVRGVALVSCIAPEGEPIAGDDDSALTQLAREDPSRASARIAESASWLADTPDRFLELPRPEPDELLLTDPAVRMMFIETIREAVKQGIDAFAWDCVLERRPWGFELSDVETNVSIWQGGQDKAVPPAVAAVLAAALPSSTSHLVSGEGHGLILARWKPILDELATA